MATQTAADQAASELEVISSPQNIAMAHAPDLAKRATAA